MRTLTIILALFLLAGPALSWGEDAVTVKTQASSLRYGEPTEVKSKAIEQALKNAVAEAASMIMTAEGMPEDLDTSAITSDPRAYIINYKVISEAWINAEGPESEAPIVQAPAQTLALEAPEGDIYNVWIEASVDASQVRAALARTADRNKAESSYAVSVLGVADYGIFKTIISTIEKIPSVKDVSYDSFLRSRISLTIRATGTAEDLLARVSKELPEGFEAVPGAYGSIIIKPAGRKGIE